MGTKFIDRHQRMIADAAGLVIAVADDSSTSLIDVIAEMERVIVEDSKVGDSANGEVPADRTGYTLKDGRLVEVQASRSEPTPAPTPDRPKKKKKKKHARPRPPATRPQRDAGRVGKLGRH